MAKDAQRTTSFERQSEYFEGKYHSMWMSESGEIGVISPIGPIRPMGKNAVMSPRDADLFEKARPLVAIAKWNHPVPFRTRK